MKRNKCLQKILLLFVILLVLFPENFAIINASLDFKKQNSMGNGAWMHVDTFINKTNQQIHDFAEMLKISEITNIFILAKNIDGTLTYPSNIGIKCYKDDTMRSLVSILNSNNIKIYFYYPINTDPSWVQKYPESVAYQCGTSKNKTPTPEPSHKLVNLTNKNYQNYINKVIEEALNLYPIDGIQLDYIRYINGFYGFSADEIKEASLRKIPMQKIIDLTYKTFISPGDWKTILESYDDGDPDVLAWAKLREDIVYRFLESASVVVKKKSKEIGSTFVSSGATSKAYTAIHFGQSWEKMSSILNFATPMAYHGNRNNVYQFVSEVCVGAISKINSSCKIAIGIQANLTSTKQMMYAIQAVKDNQFGFVLFRIGTFSFNGFDLSPINKNYVLLKITINNCLEDVQIKGLSIMQTGNCIHFIDLQKSWKLLNQDINSIKLVTSDPIKFGSNEVLNFKIDFNWNQLNNYFSPYIILSSESNDFPTFNFSFFSTHQLTYNLKKGESFYDQALQKHGFILYEQKKCWIDINDLNLIFDFDVEKEKDTFTICNKSIQLIINQSNKKSLVKSGNKQYNLMNELFFIKDNFLPLKELFEIFKIEVLYNSMENQINCLYLHRDTSTSLYGDINEISPLDLWITDANEIITDLNTYLTSSFYKQNNKYHLLGRSIKLLSKKEIISPKDSERILMLIEENKDCLFLPDQMSYLCANQNDSMSIPTNRELIVYDSDLLSFNGRKHKNVSVLTTIDKLYKLSNLHQYYINLSGCQISDWHFINGVNKYKIRGLYFLQSSQF